LPVGKLKWSKDDELEQNTKINLESKDRDSKETDAPKEVNESRSHLSRAGKPAELSNEAGKPKDQSVLGERSIEILEAEEKKEKNEKKKEIASQEHDQKDRPKVDATFRSPNLEAFGKPTDSDKPIQPEKAHVKDAAGENVKPLFDLKNSATFEPNGEQESHLEQRRKPNPPKLDPVIPTPFSSPSSPSGESEESVSPQAAKRNLSLEDTMGPIDFKEYFIDPAKDEQDIQSKEYQTEVKKPAFMASNKPAKPRKVLEVETDDFATDRTEQIAKTAIKILWLPGVLFIVLIMGLMIGHSAIGGEPALDVFDLGMWEHLYRLIFS